MPVTLSLPEPSTNVMLSNKPTVVPLVEPSAKVVDRVALPDRSAVIPVATLRRSICTKSVPVPPSSVSPSAPA